MVMENEIIRYIDECRKDINRLAEAVLRDEKGRGVRQALVHKLIQWFIDKCLKEGKKRIVISAPVGHGKSEQVAILRTIKFLGEDQELRIKIITNIPALAEKRVTAIEKYLEDEDYKVIYPNVIPDKNKWSTSYLRLQRKSFSSDNSVEAFGVLSSGEGTRCDVIVFDDICDLENSLLSETLRNKVYETVTQKWLNRLEPNGIVLIVRTIWHEDDAVERLLRTGMYEHLKIAVSEDKTKLEVEINGKRKKPIPLWRYTPFGEKWTKERLQHREDEIGAMHYNRAFRQIAFSVEEVYFDSFDDVVFVGMNPKNFRTVTRAAGVDISGKNRPGTIISVVGLTEEGKKVLLDGTIIKNPNQLGQALVKMYMKHRLDLIYVENNGVQSFIEEQLKLVITPSGRKIHLPVEGYLTGKQKFDPVLGLPGMSTEMRNRSWIFPMPNHDEGCNCFFCRAYKEFKYYPYYSTTDVVMATWFASKALQVDHNINIATI